MAVILISKSKFTKIKRNKFLGGFGMANKPVFGPAALRPGELSELPTQKQESDSLSEVSGLRTRTPADDPAQVLPTHPIPKTKANKTEPSESPSLSQAKIATKPKRHFLQKIYQLQSPWAWGLYYIIAIIGFFMSKDAGVGVSVMASVLFPFAILIVEKLMGRFHHTPYQLLKFLWQSVRKGHRLMALLLLPYGLIMLFYFMAIYTVSWGLGVIGIIYAIIRGLKN